jgi:hypothetical protein
MGIKDNSNTKSIIFIDDKPYKRIKYGDEDDDWDSGNHKCGDCGTKEGEYHHIGCDIEVCPKCGFQLITCDCLGDASEYFLAE